MRHLLLATALLTAAVNAAAQSHEPAAKPTVSSAAKPAASVAAAAKGVAPVEPAKAPGEGEHAAAPAAKADGHTETAAAKAGAARPGPVVSRITAAPKPAGHADAEESAGGRAKPRVSGANAPLPGTKSAPAAHDAAPVIAVPVAAVARPVDPKAPVKLETVHGRIAAALAGMRAESKAGKGEGEPGDGTPAAAGGARPRRETAPGPRYQVTWPEPRWRVTWPDGSDRMTVSWPE